MDIRECETLLNHYEIVVLTLHECHKNHAILYKRLSSLLSFCIIVLGTITGTSSVGTYNNISTPYEMIDIIFAFIITVLATCQQIIDPSKRYERFRNASEEYITLFYEIKYKTTFELQAEEELKAYVQQLNIQLEDMRIKFPFINDTTYDNFKQHTVVTNRVKQIEV